MLWYWEENALDRSLKHFPLTTGESFFAKAFSINRLKEMYLYEITEDFPLTSIADSHSSEE